MNEDYIKTLVIDDPNYRPGDLLPEGPAKIKAPKLRQPPVDTDETVEADILPGDVPAFDDTSWLT
ncbi:MAG: hypothetical protein AAFU65_08845 [Pseudomonadota bacterium]